MFRDLSSDAKINSFLSKDRFPDTVTSLKGAYFIVNILLILSWLLTSCTSQEVEFNYD